MHGDGQGGENLEVEFGRSDAAKVGGVGVKGENRLAWQRQSHGKMESVFGHGGGYRSPTPRATEKMENPLKVSLIHPVTTESQGSPERP
jgi:hypothetical protein